MSSDSSAKLIFGMPCEEVVIREEYLEHLTESEIQDMLESDTYEYIQNIESLDGIERCIHYDSCEIGEQIIGIEISRVDWGSVEVDLDTLNSKLADARVILGKYIENYTEGKLQLCSEWS